MTNLFHLNDKFLTVHNKYSKLPPSFSMHFENRVRKSRVTSGDSLGNESQLDTCAQEHSFPQRLTVIASQNIDPSSLIILYCTLDLEGLLLTVSLTLTRTTEGSTNLTQKVRLNRRLGGLQNRHWRFTREKSVLLVPGIEPRSSAVQPVA
jgi:hypothetical protein